MRRTGNGLTNRCARVAWPRVTSCGVALSIVNRDGSRRRSAIAIPLLKPPVARLIGGIAVREVGPWGAGPEDPQDAVEHRTISRHGRPGRLCGAPAWAGRVQSEPIARR